MLFKIVRCRDRTITDGWKRTGLFPLNFITILSQCPRAIFKSMKAGTAVDICLACKRLLDEIQEEGELFDEQIEKALGDSFESGGREIKDWIDNHCRALWLNKESDLVKGRKEISAKKKRDAEKSKQVKGSRRRK